MYAANEVFHTNSVIKYLGSGEFAVECSVPHLQLALASQACSAKNYLLLVGGGMN